MPRLQHNQPYNAKFQNEQITIKWQCLNTKPSIKNEITKFPYKEIQKNKAHLEVHFGVWSMGLRVLEEPFFLIPFKWWVILFPIKSERRWCLGRCHYQCKKNESLEMGFKNGFVTKVVKNTKIWKNDWGRWMKASWETWESDFLEKKWCNEGENASGRREWIVTMEEERREKSEEGKA